MPCCNCLVTVPQDRWYAVETFGAYSNTLGPGLACTGVDIGGLCITLRSISTRVEQLDIRVTTKTSDNVFVTAVVAVQQQVAPDRVCDALYKLADIQSQVDAYVSDVVRSAIPLMTLDEAFEKKDALSLQVQQSLSQSMLNYGFLIHKALITELQVNSEVMTSMNEINKQRRLRDAAVMQAEADKVRVVKAAEADADAACLAGEGIARQRAAILDGLRHSITAASQEELPKDELSSLLLITQYFDTLKQIGNGPNCKAYLLPDMDPNDPEAMTRYGMLQADAALETIGKNLGVGGGGGGSKRGSPRTSPRPGLLGHSSPAPAPPQQSMSRPAPYRAPTLSEITQQPPPRAPSPPPRAAPAYAAPTRMQIQVPMNAGPGSVLQVQAPDGRTVQVQVPPGVAGGSVLTIQV